MTRLARTCSGCDTSLAEGGRYCAMCGAETSLAGQCLAGRYVVEDEIGAGGTATVHLARDLRHGRQVAVKVLRQNVGRRVGSKRFLREIEIASRLHHPHILPVYDSGEVALEEGDTRLLFYVMPLATESLGVRLARGPVPLAEAVRILGQVADALAFAHAQGVVHRDIKPDNVLLSGRHAMVADFGIAKAHDTGGSLPIGTPYYMSPEQVSGDPQMDGRADQYALGVLAYEMLTGRRPFTGETVHQILAAQLLDSPDPVDRVRPEVPTALARIVMRCLEKEPAHRWARSDELAERLEAVGYSAMAYATASSALN